MIEREEVIAELAAAGVLDRIRWAHQSAVASVMTDHPADSGYTNITYANALYDLTIDRQDRVFQTGRYRPDPAHPEAGADILQSGIHPEKRWPGALDAGVVRRSDLYGSQGWRWGRWRWLRQSCVHGEVRSINWAEKGLIKQRVAAMAADLDGQVALISREEAGDEGEESDDEFADTLIVAQSIDATTGGSELYLGRARFVDDGGPSWHWLHDLLGPGPAGWPHSEGGTTLPTGPAPSHEVDDAPVQLRPSASPQKNRASDQE